MAKDTAYHMVLEMADLLRGVSYDRTVIYERFDTSGNFSRGATGQASSAIKDLTWACISTEWMQSLATGTQLFVLNKLLPELKMYNLLYYHPVTKQSSIVRAIKELVDKKIMYRTEKPGFYLINPLNMWRGNPLTSLIETKEMLREHKHPSIELIKDRRPSKEYRNLTSAEQFKLLNS